MKFYSTNNHSNIVDLKEAVLSSFPVDRGLYMPTDIQKLDINILNNLESYSFKEIGFMVTELLTQGSLSKNDLYSIIDNSLDFDVPIVKLNNSISVLELFHGPTLAFKDFGAKFMAQLFKVLIKDDNKTRTILVATSGDTGGAVASGFLNTDGIEVIILFPKGKVSFLQKQQLTTLGNNIKAIEIDGSFDDCQNIVKDSFIDMELNSRYKFSSANSINIARLIPQSFYYFESFKSLNIDNKRIIYSVPSGNLGNLTAGLIAKRMGLRIDKFISSNNSNKVFHNYINSGIFTSKDSIQTISNAMDVGNPSNFYRILDLYCSTWNNIKNDITSVSISDQKTLKYIEYLNQAYNYIADPHSAVAYGGLDLLLDPNKEIGVLLATAHPSKFLDIIEPIIKKKIIIPDRLSNLSDKESKYISLSSSFDTFKSFLLD